MIDKTTIPLKCLIIDDERDSHLVLEHHLGQIPWLNLAGNVYNAVDALVEIPRCTPDLIFLDVNMPSLSGLQLMEMLPAIRSQVILTTAYTKYAMDGYDFDIVDFLLKPATFERFLKAVNKARINHEKRYQENSSTKASYLSTNDPLPKSYAPAADSGGWKDLPSPSFGTSHAIFRVEKKLYRIPYDSIIFIESIRNYVNVHTLHGCLTTRGSLTKFNGKLPETLFLRTHKSYIVNCDHALEIEGNQLILEKNYRVMISKAERNEVLKALAR